jgi:hypothetical protein
MKTQNRKMVGQNNRIKNKTKHKNNKAKFLLDWSVQTSIFFCNLLRTNNDNMFTSPITISSLLHKDM